MQSTYNKMVSDNQYNGMKAKMPQIKQLFQTRHYIQCKAVCEEHLKCPRNQIHPIHRAYLHFYLAMSHDAVAREATLKHRHRELELAEKHYIAALAALTPPTGKLEDIDELSPTSSVAEDEPSWIVRRGSDASSSHSVASSATSMDNDGSVSNWETAPLRLSSKNSDVSKRALAPLITTNHQTVHHQHHQFFVDLVSFISLVQQHLANVCKLRENAMVRTVRFDTPPPQPHFVRSRPVSGDSSYYDEAEMKKRRRYRKNVTFRPRFDPSSVQQLCAEAIAEL